MNFDRNIFTESKPSRLERFADVALAILLALSLCMLTLHALDALFA
jgi:hypothetical protein